MLRRYLAVLAATAVAGATSLAMTGAASAAAPAPAMTRLGADVIPGLSALAPSGATPSSTAVEVDIALSGANPAAEAAELKAVYTPGSPDYHHFLTTAQIASEFGAPAGYYRAALSYGTAHGLTVNRVSTSRDLIVLTGTVGQAETTFGVTIDNYVWHGLHFYANANAPTVPAGIGIIGVVGLNTAQVMHTNSLKAGSRPQQSFCQTPASNGAPCMGATTPEDMWSTYDQPAGDTGQGQRVAIFGEGAWTPPIQDLRDFEANPDQLSTCGAAIKCSDALPNVPVRVVEVDGAAAKYTDTAGDEEWDIDTQSSTGMAPNLSELDLYFGTSLTDADVLSVVDDWAGDSAAPLQASASYGECEYDPAAQQLPSGTDFAMGQAAEASYQQTLEGATLEGRTLFSSAGDDGSSCPVVPVDTNGVANQAFPDVNVPCALPEVTCVGGTVLYTTGATPNQRSVEYSWNDTGGGSSLIYPEPSWQAKINGTGSGGPGTMQCPYDEAGNPNTSAVPCRAVPDIAAQSGDIVTNGYGIYYDGSATQQGGTSLSSPLSLGMWARVQAAAPQNSSSSDCAPYCGNGLADPSLYQHESAFYDIGNPNDTPPSPPTSNGYFVSGPGWDYTSGLGVMNVTPLTQALDGSTTPINDVPSPNSNTVSYYDGTNGSLLSTSGGGSGSGNPVDAACVPLWSAPNAQAVAAIDPTGTDYPQMALVQGDIHNTSTSLTTVLTVNDMKDSAGSTPPYGTANEYYMYWTYAGTTYFTNAEVTVAGTIDYSYGTVNKVGTSNQYQSAGSLTTGSITTGPDGQISVTVPLSDVGHPGPGAVLTGLGGESDELVGVPTAGGSLQVLDTQAANYPYTLGEVCAATGNPGTSGGTPGGGQVPEAPVAAAIPVIGLGAAGLLIRRRRRRTVAIGAK